MLLHKTTCAHSGLSLLFSYVSKHACGPSTCVTHQPEPYSSVYLGLLSSPTFKTALFLHKMKVSISGTFKGFQFCGGAGKRINGAIANSLFNSSLSVSLTESSTRIVGSTLRGVGQAETRILRYNCLLMM